MLGNGKRFEDIADSFYASLRQEVIEGNPHLNEMEQIKLRRYYPVMVNHKCYPPDLVAMVYSSRRCHAVRVILESKDPVVLDAGCAFGSESFLFASLGAKVFAIDNCGERIAIAEKRKSYYEELFERPLNIKFILSNLEEYVPEAKNISLTWLASVLAAIRDQRGLLQKMTAS